MFYTERLIEKVIPVADKPGFSGLGGSFVTNSIVAVHTPVQFPAADRRRSSISRGQQTTMLLKMPLLS
jgi:hypothetical protein